MWGQPLGYLGVRRRCPLLGKALSTEKLVGTALPKSPGGAFKARNAYESPATPTATVSPTHALLASHASFTRGLGPSPGEALPARNVASLSRGLWFLERGSARAWACGGEGATGSVPTPDVPVNPTCLLWETRWECSRELRSGFSDNAYEGRRPHVRALDAWLRCRSGAAARTAAGARSRAHTAPLQPPCRFPEAAGASGGDGAVPALRASSPEPRRERVPVSVAQVSAATREGTWKVALAVERGSRGCDG